MSGREIETGTREILCRVEERVGILTLNRPDARNALTMDMKRALADTLPVLGGDEGVGCVLLTGAGGAFCAGGDTKNMQKEGKPPSPETRKRQLRWEHTISEMLHDLEKPTVAALPGPAAGAGFALALACDIRIAAEGAFFTTAYARLGLAGDYGSSWFLTQIVGTAKARELMFTAERIDAREAERLGLVNRTVPDGNLEKEAMALAAKIASGPPIALRWMKDHLHRAQTHDLHSMLALEADRMVDGAATEDYIEAINAFREKRTPVFKGR